MAVYSKHHLTAALKTMACDELAHPFTPRCGIFFLDMISSAIRGNYKFFIVMFLVQLAMKGRKVTREYLKRELIGLVRTTLFGTTMISLGVSLSCALRWFFGRYYYHTVVFAPTSIAAASTIFIERPIRRTLYAFTFSQMCVEYWFRLLDTSGIFAFTKWRETLLFMCSNAMLLYLLKTDTSNTHSYWFFKPSQSQHTDGNPKTRCSHSGSCRKYVIKNASKYMGIGLGIQFLRVLLTKTRILFRKPRTTMKAFLSNRHTFELGSFLAAYIGIYTSVMCLLCRWDDGESDLHTLPAGFLAGSAFWLHSNRTIGASAITNTLQLLLSRGISSKAVKVLPYFSELTFSLFAGMLFHARFVDADRCPSFISKLLSTISRGRIDYVYRNFEKMMETFYKTML